MMHKITKEEEKEFKSIYDLLCSTDEECVSLGIEFLRTYPYNMRCIIFENCHSQKLGLLLYQYDLTCNNIRATQFWLIRLEAFVNGILRNKIYFI